ncbi:centromere-associated protein E-like [Diaphorina citri]|uniref:Centromere-associated protein E-like n=1 Tax=Diaphorina citri TaxID=121845 RepID=A0A3Q0JL95_DIACI|nr:centromere-associated protein E-like [Diaphorina citri]
MSDDHQDFKTKFNAVKEDLHGLADYLLFNKDFKLTPEEIEDINAVKTIEMLYLDADEFEKKIPHVKSGPSKSAKTLELKQHSKSQPNTAKSRNKSKNLSRTLIEDFNMSKHGGDKRSPKVQTRDDLNNLTALLKEKDEKIKHAMEKLELLMEKFQSSQNQIKSLTRTNEAKCQKIKQETEAQFIKVIEEKDEAIEVLLTKVQNFENVIRSLIQEAEEKNQAFTDDKKQVIDMFAQTLDTTRDQFENNFLSSKVKMLETTIQNNKDIALRREQDYEQEISTLKQTIHLLTRDKEELIEVHNKLESENSKLLLELQKNGPCDLKSTIYEDKEIQSDLIPAISGLIGTVNDEEHNIVNHIRQTARKNIDTNHTQTDLNEARVDDNIHKTEINNYFPNLNSGMSHRSVCLLREQCLNSKSFTFTDFKQNLLQCADLVDQMKVHLEAKGLEARRLHLQCTH